MNIDKTSEAELDFYRIRSSSSSSSSSSGLLGGKVKIMSSHFDLDLIRRSDVPVYALGNTPGDRDGVRPLRGKSFRPFAEVVDEDGDAGVSLLRLRKRTWQTHGTRFGARTEYYTAGK